MTNKPTDHEIDVFVQVCREKGMRELDVFQAVLTRWGQPAHSGEPVAWLDPWTGTNVTADPDAYGKHGIPLYTAPQPSPAAQGYALDAARLDWLESNSQINIERVRYLGATKSIYEVTPYDSIGYDGETLRDAIDAARAAQEGKKP